MDGGPRLGGEDIEVLFAGIDFERAGLLGRLPPRAIR